VNVSKLFDLSGRTAIVSGGATGLGRQAAEAFAEAGADVLLCARNEERCIAAAKEIATAHGVRAVGMRCDVRDPADVAAVVERTTGELGGIDVLFNCAGTNWAAPPEDVPLEAWEKVIAVNLTGAFLFSQAAGRTMIAAGGGSIVNVASVAAFRGAPAEAMDALPYNASKGGLVAMTIDLAVKWARHGIRVNAIAPGWFPSDMSAKVLERAGETLLQRIPMQRFGGADELKGAALFLAAPASAYVTGHTLVVDGGMLAGG
jgi:NAD(P)-dependent dehydrogenase (short-subunit alcohol dehydrogenase family)